MNIGIRLTKLEQSIPERCPACGIDLAARRKAEAATRPHAEKAIADFLALNVSRDQANACLCEDWPEGARSLGLNPKPEQPGFCPACGEDRRTPEQRLARDRQIVAECLDSYREELRKERGLREPELSEAARVMLREDAPDLAALLPVAA